MYDINNVVSKIATLAMLAQQCSFEDCHPCNVGTTMQMLWLANIECIKRLFTRLNRF